MYKNDKIVLSSELLNSEKVKINGCISLIGMAGAGKSTVGYELSKMINWEHLDSDNLIEKLREAKLQQVVDSMTKDEFLDLEAKTIQEANLNQVVLSTGGSAVYRSETMLHLATLGPIIYLDVPWEIIEERVSRRPNRGVAKAPGQTLRDLYEERKLLYEQAATYKVIGSSSAPIMQAKRIVEWLSTPFNTSGHL